MDEKFLRELMNMDITIYRDGDEVEIQADVSHYGLFVFVKAESASYRILHSEDGVMDEGEFAFDNREFLEEVAAEIYSFSRALELIKAIPSSYVRI
jgi:hypothetical protein